MTPEQENIIREAEEYVRGKKLVFGGVTELLNLAKEQEKRIEELKEANGILSDEMTKSANRANRWENLAAKFEAELVSAKKRIEELDRENEQLDGSIARLTIGIRSLEAENKHLREIIDPPVGEGAYTGEG